MSAKGRGPKLDETGQDFYGTPAWCVQVLHAVYTPPPGLLLDPCCGEGAIIDAWPEDQPWWACDIRPEAVAIAEQNSWVRGALTGDCTVELEGLKDSGVGAIITNPPYSDAAKIIRWLLDNRPSKADVVMLLRLPWMCAKKGRHWIREDVPDVYVLSDRPSFKGGKTDMADYGWFVWPPGQQSVGQIFHCPSRKTL